MQTTASLNIANARVTRCSAARDGSKKAPAIPAAARPAARPATALKAGNNANVKAIAVEAPAKAAPAPFTETPSMDSIFADYAKSFLSVGTSTETEGELVVEGEIPKEIEGTLLRNGPALFERDGFSKEFLDGDGMVSTVAIKDGKAYFRNKFVRTPGLVTEEKQGYFSELSIFTEKDPRPSNTGKPVWQHRLVEDILQGPPKIKHNGAYNAWNWAGSLVAVDFGMPHALDPETLETVPANSTFSKEKFTAHSRVMTEKDGSKRMVCFSPYVDWAKQETQCVFMEFDEAGEVAKRKEFTFGAAYFHDLIVTENWYILFDCPIKMDYYKAFIGYAMEQNSLGDTISEDRNRPPTFRLFPRHGDGPMKEVKVKDFHCFAYHHINGFDVNEDGSKVVFDTCTWDKFNLYFKDIVEPDGVKAWPRTEISRFHLDVDSGVATRTKIDDTPSEYPTTAESVTGKPYKHAYMGVSAVRQGEVNGPLQALDKMTFKTNEADCTEVTHEKVVFGERKFIGEPLFIKRPGGTEEDDGWLIMLVHDCSGEGTTEVTIVDAQKVSEGAVATMKLPAYVPMGVHGSWTSDYILGPKTA
mmetsp:Transcript_19749/g.62829  ORF Transcript_19749/g.62829 Transcript_19749/m.62829 type:complete len:585 (-) Transcript_19749:135-1889(-)